MSPSSASPAPSSDPRRWPVRRAESFGGVVVRAAEGGYEVALIRVRSRQGRDVWTLPKGGADEGEDHAAAALREVREETGIEAEVIEPLDKITYWFVWAPDQARYRKTVHFYLMRAVGGDPAAHDDEVEEVRFVPVDDAPRLASYPTDRKILRRVAELARSW